MPVRAVVIAASNLMPSLQGRLADDGPLLTFPDTEPIQALQAIIEHTPSIVVLERLFAATPRGAALVNRIKNDPELGHAEVRVMSHAGDYNRVVSAGRGSRSAAPPASAAASASGPRTSAGPADDSAPPATAAVGAEAPRPLDWQGTRRAPRHVVREGVEIQLDGNRARVVDMSLVGAQVLSATILRPNQKVRVSVPDDDFVLRFRGSVAWAKFELPRPTEPPRYRAGLEFADADPSSIDAFCRKHRA